MAELGPGLGGLLAPGTKLVSSKLWVPLDAGLPDLSICQLSLQLTNTFSVSLPSLEEAKMRREAGLQKGMLPRGAKCSSAEVSLDPGWEPQAALLGPGEEGTHSLLHLILPISEDT